MRTTTVFQSEPITSYLSLICNAYVGRHASTLSYLHENGCPNDMLGTHSKGGSEFLGENIMGGSFTTNLNMG